MYKKIIWTLRRLCYAFLFKNIHYYGYLGKPLVTVNLRSLTLERKTRIYPNSRIEIYGEESYIKIREDVSIGQGFHVTSAGKLEIDSGTVISGNVVVTNIDHIYDDIDVPVLEQGNKVSDTYIGRNCFIGFGAVIQAGTYLGNNCIIGANSVVRGKFDNGCVIVGSPGKVVKRHIDGHWQRVIDNDER